MEHTFLNDLKRHDHERTMGRTDIDEYCPDICLDTILLSFCLTHSNL